MLVFIIPLKSAKVSASWQQVSQLFERTIKSVCNQTSAKFKVIVVCNERPEIEFEHPNITYIEVDFLPPTGEKEGDKSYQSKDADKQKKIFVGLTQAYQFNPTHVMFVDADDCVSKHLAHFVSQNPGSNGWIFNRGYEYIDGSKSILLRNQSFNYRCGTSSIVRYDLVAPDETLRVDDINHRWLYHGGPIKKALQKKGYSWDILPFPGSVYITEHGSNMVNQRHLQLQRANSILEKLRVYFRIFGKRLLSQSLTDSLREEFGLREIQHSRSQRKPRLFKAGSL
jgi:hypothetical protein